LRNRDNDYGICRACIFSALCNAQTCGAIRLALHGGSGYRPLQAMYESLYNLKRGDKGVQWGD